MSKPYFSLKAGLEALAENFRASGNFTPTHCDVRCHVNDMLDDASRSGYRVNHGYSQDRAFAIVRRTLRHG